MRETPSLAALSALLVARRRSLLDVALGKPLVGLPLGLVVRPLALGVGRRLVKLLRGWDRVGLVEVSVIDLDELPAWVRVLDVGLANGR